MPCTHCPQSPVYTTLNHQPLCKNCFIKYFEKKVYKTITTYKMIEPGEHLGVGVSGGKDSITCLYLLNKFFEKKGNKITAIAINEGIHGYRDATLKDAATFCAQHHIPLHITSYKQEFGMTLDDYLKKHNINPCSACGVMRRYLLNKAARTLHADKLATGHNLDDEAQSVLMNNIKGNLALSAKLGPVTGVVMHKKFIPRIKPLYFMTEKETTIYSKLKEFPVTYNVCPNFGNNFREHIGRVINDLEHSYPGTKHGIINSFLDILPELKKKYQHASIGTCTQCGEPSAQQTCRLCHLLA